MNGKSRPTGGSQTPTKKSARSVARTADRVLADALAKGRADDVAILRWLLGRAA